MLITDWRRRWPKTGDGLEANRLLPPRSGCQAAASASPSAVSPPYVPFEADRRRMDGGSRWGATKLTYARALAPRSLRLRVWPGSTLNVLPGQALRRRSQSALGALRLITGGRRHASGALAQVCDPASSPPRDDRRSSEAKNPALPSRPRPFSSDRVRPWAAACTRSSCAIPLAADSRVLGARRSAIISGTGGSRPEAAERPPGCQAARWPLAKEARNLLNATGPRRPAPAAQILPGGRAAPGCSTLRISSRWLDAVSLPPLAASPLQQLLEVIGHGQCRLESALELEGVLPIDMDGPHLAGARMNGRSRCAGGEPAGLPQLGEYRR